MHPYQSLESAEPGTCNVIDKMYFQSLWATAEHPPYHLESAQRTSSHAKTKFNEEAPEVKGAADGTKCERTMPTSGVGCSGQGPGIPIARRPER